MKSDVIGGLWAAANRSEKMSGAPDYYVGEFARLHFLPHSSRARFLYFEGRTRLL